MSLRHRAGHRLASALHAYPSLDGNGRPSEAGRVGWPPRHGPVGAGHARPFSYTHSPWVSFSGTATSSTIRARQAYQTLTILLR